jgi:hypothetical protein
MEVLLAVVVPGHSLALDPPQQLVLAPVGLLEALALVVALKTAVQALLVLRALVALEEQVE